jgi:hypothetical protein
LIINSIFFREFATKAPKHQKITKGFGAIWCIGDLVATYSIMGCIIKY